MSTSQLYDPTEYMPQRVSSTKPFLHQNTRFLICELVEPFHMASQGGLSKAVHLTNNSSEPVMHCTSCGHRKKISVWFFKRHLELIYHYFI